MNQETPAPETTEADMIWRAATTADLSDMEVLERELFPADAWSLEVFEQELHLVPQEREYLVGRDNLGELVGYGGIAIMGPDSNIMTFAISRNYQGRGLGKQFLDFLLGRSHERGCTRVLLEVRADNHPAIALYQKAGFVEDVRRKRYYKDGVDAILMSLDLIVAKVRAQTGEGEASV